jgi:hypothetical protein
VLYDIGYPIIFKVYSDNWISDTKDSKFTSEYIFTLGELAVS